MCLVYTSGQRTRMDLQFPQTDGAALVGCKHKLASFQPEIGLKCKVVVMLIDTSWLNSVLLLVQVQQRCYGNLSSLLELWHFLRAKIVQDRNQHFHLERR